MANLANLKADFNSGGSHEIYTNGEQAITGVRLNYVLNNIVNTLGDGYRFAGIVTRSSDAITTDNKVFVVASEPGSYTNFGGLTVEEGELAFLYFDTDWHKGTVEIGGGTRVTMSVREGTLYISGVESEWEPTGGIDEYIQNGLVLHLDGIEKGNIAGHWTPYIGNADFIADGVTFGTDHIVFPSGTGLSHLYSAVCPEVNNGAGTIEIVFDSHIAGQNRFLFYPRNGRKMCLAYASALNVFIINTNVAGATYILPTSAPDKMTLSLSNGLGILNQSRLTQGLPNFFGDSGTAHYIGKRPTASAAQTFVGKIFSIRLYDRVLSEAEVLRNQRVDEIRFNL